MQNNELTILCDNIIKELDLEDKANLELLEKYKLSLSKKITELNIKDYDNDMTKFVKIKSYYRNIFQALMLFIACTKIDINNPDGKMIYCAYYKQYKYYKEKFLEDTLI